MAFMQGLGVLICISFVGHIVAYKPVLIIHGVLDGAAELDDLKQLIVKVSYTI